MSKLTNRERANIIIKEGKIISTSCDRGMISSIIVEAFGQRYKIRYPYTKSPKITQLEKTSATAN